MNFDCAIIGGGIVGLAVAQELLLRQPGLRTVLLEKEDGLAAHQTGRNSGVIHSGIYYKPGSLKARFAREGSQKLVRFCQQHGLPHSICGKLIVATEEAELPGLRKLFERGQQNQLDVAWVAPEEAKSVEPHVACRAAVRVPSTGIVSYRAVCAKLAELYGAAGGEVRLGTRVDGIVRRADGYILETARGAVETRFLINCAGLHSDRVARRAGAAMSGRIVPFRGEYYELTPARRDLVRTLIYPVPNPAFPFLGVHFTRMIDGSVHAGPNAVLAFKREGYHRSDVSVSDLLDTLTFGGFWRLARRHLQEGLGEMHRSLSKAAFVRSLQRLVPEVQANDLIPSEAGVRAQALLPDGQLVDDFLIVQDQNALHVCNAPSPAATASLSIGESVVGQLPDLRRSTNAFAAR